MINTDSTDKLFYKFQKLVSSYKELEQSRKTWGTDEILTSAEIHLIEKIGSSNGNLSVTELAKAMEITKGAVSQRLKRLEKKGLIKKNEDPNNESRLNITLSKKGAKAYKKHLEWHQNMDGGYKKYLQSLDDEKVEFLDEFLTRVIDFMQRAQSADNN